MKLIAILTLGLFGRTKPVKLPVGPKVYKPLIGDVWEYKDSSEWVVPRPETVDQIEILNVAGDGSKVLYKRTLIQGKCAKNGDNKAKYKLQKEMDISMLKSMYFMKHSPIRATERIKSDFSKGMRLTDSEFKPLAQAMRDHNVVSPVFDDNGQIVNRADFEGSPV